jgi:hypothetical protein
VINKAKWRCGENHQNMQSSELKWSGESEEKGSKLWRGCEGCISVVKWNEGKIMVKCSVHDIKYFINVTV